MDKTIGKYKGVDIKAGDDASVASQIQSIDSGTPIAVDTLSRKADPNVTRGVEIVNENAMQSTTPDLTQGINNTASVLPPPPKSEATQNRELLSNTAKDLLETDVRSERLKAREDAGVIEKEAVQRQEYDALTRAREDKRLRVEEIQRQSGLTKAQKDAMVSEESRVFDRQIADKSFSYNVALGDYQAAEKIANDYIADLQTERTNKQNAWSMLFQLAQNDMTESEKIEAQQAFQEKQMKDKFELDKESARFMQTLQQSDPKYMLEVANLKNQIEASKIEAQNNQDLELLTKIQGVELKSAIVDDSLAVVDRLIKNSSGLSASVGSVPLFGRLPYGMTDAKEISSEDGKVNFEIGGGLGFRFGNKADFLTDASYIINNLTFDKLKELKASGASFGALSEGELKAIGDASGVLSAMAIKKDGQITGFKGTETKALEQIQLIQSKLQKERDALGSDLLSPQEQLQIYNLPVTQ